MSNYHGAPHYGGPFNYNGQFVQPIAPPQQVGLYGMMPQTSFSTPRGPPSIQPLQNYQPPHFSNSYNYSTGSQFSHNIVPGSGPPPLPPYSYYANYASHAANGIPPPPFPPIPIPNHNFTSQRPAISVPLPTSPANLVSPAGLPPRPPSPREPVSGLFEHGTALVAAVNDREDGELSDVEQHGSPSNSGSINSDEPQEVITVPQRETTVRPAVRVQSPSTATVGPSKNRNHNISQSSDSLSPAMNEDTRSPQSYSQIIHTTNAASAVPNGSVNIGNAAAAANQKFIKPRDKSSKVYSDSNGVAEQRILDLNAGLYDTDRSSSSAKVGKQDTGGRYHTLRGQVKSALLDLYQGQIGFESLLAEGVDASILRVLYHDIGIQVNDGSTISDDLPPTGENSLQSEISAHNLPTGINSLAEPSQSSLALSTPLPRFTEANKFPGPSSSALVSQSAQIQDGPESRAVAVPVPPETLKDTRSNSSPVLASQSAKPIIVGSIKTSAIVAIGDRALERKDYIAKMLAAKAGRGAALKSPKSVEPAKVLKAPLAQDIAAADIVLEAPLPESSDPSPSRLPSNIQDDLEAKKKASTDLARRKMEALMTRSTEAQVASSGGVTASRIEEVLPEIAFPESREESVLPTGRASVLSHSQIVEQSVVLSNSSSQQYTPATPFFASLERKPTMGLPGLSMSYSSNSSPITLREPIINAVAAPIHQASSLSTLEKNNRTRAISPPMPESLVEQPSIDSSNSIDDRMTGIVSNSGVENTSPTITRKRATAADFIDGPADNMKRRAGSNGYIEVVIEVSDDEGLVEDDDMDIESVVQDSSTEVFHAAQTSKSKAIRDLPPLTNFPSRSIAPNVAYTNSTTPVQTSGKPGELTETEEKIRLLKQMIAEKEERQRARLTSSGAQSPGPTTLRLQSVPAFRDPSPTRSSSGSLIIEKKTRVLDAVKNELEDQKVVLAAAETAVKGRLEAEETAHASVSARVEEERVEALRATTATERQYREKRRLALEAALPELDAQIQVARGKLDDISRQRVELEAELQRGSEGRKKILEELDTLLTALEVDKNMDDALSDETRIRGSSSGLTQAQDSQRNFRDSPAKLTRESTTPSTIASTISQATQNDKDQVIAETNGFSPRQGSAEEIMDISSVSNDETQLDELNPKDPVEHLNGTDSELGYDEYEPRLENDLLPQPSVERDNSIQFVHDESSNSFPSGQLQVTSIEQGNVVQKLERPEADSSSLEDGEISRSVSPDEAGDSDDYEPPEPQLLVDNRASQETDVFSPRSPTPRPDSPSEVEVVPESQITVRKSPTAVDLTAEVGTSDDVSTVRNVSQAPSSLKSGHFSPYQNDMILVQLGSIHEGSNLEEKNAYVNGLKQIIHDMRSRRVTDFNTVAREITAYRASFLGDNSRILTL
ncbi:hypothetical protein MMC11_005218 [Xylographa trunciseda]|nr:hypothetical protein [Xylographa trunciseda]